MFLTWQFIYSGEVKRSGKGQNASGSFSTGDGDTPVQYQQVSLTSLNGSLS